MGKHKVKRRPKEQRSCKQCGADFFAPANLIAKGGGVFCGRKCMGESQARPLAVHTCQCCGKVFGAKKKERRYCSRACFQKVRAESGKKKHHGRGHKHDKWVLAVILRDRKCVRCGEVENLQAHHLKTWKSNPSTRYDIDNGVALCPLCHHAQHPKLVLERFVATGGKKVKYCVVCEDAFLVKKKSQRTCSQKCGWKLKSLMGGNS